MYAAELPSCDLPQTPSNLRLLFSPPLLLLPCVCVGAAGRVRVEAVVAEATRLRELEAAR